MIMYDSVTASNIPLTAGAVAGYVDGLYAWSAADWNRWGSGVIKVRIAVSYRTNNGDVLDIEPGNDTTHNGRVLGDNIATWVRARLSAGLLRPVLYVNDSEWADVRAAMALAQLDDKVEYWVSEPTGKQHIPEGAVACQYGWDGKFGYDLSLLSSDCPWALPPEPQPLRALGNPSTGPLWVLDYLPRGQALPAPLSAVEHISVYAPDAGSAESFITGFGAKFFGETLVGVHGPFAHGE